MLQHQVTATWKQIMATLEIRWTNGTSEGFVSAVTEAQHCFYCFQQFGVTWLSALFLVPVEGCVELTGFRCRRKTQKQSELHCKAWSLRLNGEEETAVAFSLFPTLRDSQSFLGSSSPVAIRLDDSTPSPTQPWVTVVVLSRERFKTALIKFRSINPSNHQLLQFRSTGGRSNYAPPVNRSCCCVSALWRRRTLKVLQNHWELAPWW